MISSFPSKQLLRQEAFGLVCCIFVAILYFISIPDYVLGGDNGEFVALARTGGIAHPPGYPLYVGYLRSLAWISDNPAYATGLATALLGSAQLLVLYFGLRAWGFCVVISSLILSFYGTSSLALYINSHAEVFALNSLLSAAIVLCAAPSIAPNPIIRASILGLLLGLGGSNHHSIVFMLPLVVCTLLSAVFNRKDIRVWIAVALSFLLALIVGLSPYYFLFDWSKQYGSNLLSWGVISRYSDLLHHFLRRDYGTFSLGGSDAKPNLRLQFRLLLDSFYWSWNILIPFALLALFRDLRSFSRRSAVSWRWISLWLCIFLGGPIFATRFNVSFLGIVERFHALPVMLLAFPVAKGVDLSLDFWKRQRSRISAVTASANISYSLRQLLAIVLILFASSLNYILSERRMSDRVSKHVHLLALNGLNSLPQGSIVFVNGDHQTLGYNAIQQAFGIRKDVLVVSPTMLNKWYKARIENLLGERIAGKTVSEMIFNIVQLAQSRGRPVFADPIWLRNRSDLVSYQYGVFRRAVRGGNEIPSPEKVYDLNNRIYRSYAPYSRAPLDYSWSTVSLFAYETGWRLLARDLRRLGRDDLADLAETQRKRYAMCTEMSCL